jgi:uncharacterized hydrophobic protein (TIGR00271 family)
MEKQENTHKNPPTKIRENLLGLWENTKEFLDDLLDLQEGLDKKGTIENIRNNKRMRGANAWLLMCSIMVASLGLDLNSPAVIIGAMLISPLMSPILGIGLSMGINDKRGLFTALNHFGISICIALLTSFIYFYLTPFGDPTPEIISRTAPTLLDVLIAFFGGIAGIVSGSRMDKSNAIPGVAIATALMPPLCVTGFGLANGEWDIMIKSFYLFFLNACFVALATYLIVRFLRFPIKEHLNKGEAQKARLFIMIFGLVILIPSLFILLGVLQKVQQKQSIERFVKTHFPDAHFPKPVSIGDTDSVEVKLFLFEEFTDDSLIMYRNKFYEQVNNAVLKFVQIDSKDEITKKDFSTLEKSIKGELISMIEAEKVLKDEKDRKIEQLQFKLDSLSSDPVIFQQVQEEVKALFPELEEIGYARMEKSNFDTIVHEVPTFLIKWGKSKRARDKKQSEERIENFIRVRADLDTIILVKN